jgi:hypothetical protein
MKGQTITQAELKRRLSYNPETGVWVWKASPQPWNVGRRAGYIDKASGRRRIKIEKKLYPSSRLAWLYMEGYFPEHQVDHINRIRDDDRWCNLRHVSPQCNIRNCGLIPNNKVGVKGIYWNKNEKKWRVHIMISGKAFHLGYFKEHDFDEAVLTRLAAEQCLGWNGCDSNSTAMRYAKKHGLIRRTPK